LGGGILTRGVPGAELAVDVESHGVEAAAPLDKETVVGLIGDGVIARAEKEKDTERGYAGYAPGV